MPARTDSRPPTFLIVDDERVIRDLVRDLGESLGFEVTTCAGGREAIAHLQSSHSDLAAVDLRMPDIGGLEVLRAIRESDSDCQVILMSGDVTIDSAVAAVKLGAIEYLTKPLDFDRLKRLLIAVREDGNRRQHLLEAEKEAAKNAAFCGMIGRGPAMLELFGFIRRVAPHVRTALICGETGSGKELVARALYRTGPRRNKRFVVMNCSAVVETLFESELFGHMKGSFTGAIDSKPGFFEAADGGTLFLDEIGELPLALQAKLLRVLETGEIQRVGATAPLRVDVHVLAATNRELRAEVAAGRFRGDLFYRLNVVELLVPPLRDRREDLPYLTACFVQESAARLGKDVVGMTPSAERTLNSRRWDGNVRELRNVIERACMLADGQFVTERELTGKPASPASPAVSTAALTQPAADALSANDERPLSALERDHIAKVLERAGGNKMTAARMLGVDRRALYRRLERYGIGSISKRPRSKL
jgi:DNA-binding NtrC family response regulator